MLISRREGIQASKPLSPCLLVSLSPCLLVFPEGNMSFRSFILYCALCGGWSALLSWALGRFITNSGIRGLLLGLLIALALALVDALWNFTMRQASKGIPQVCASAVIGAVGGLMGGAMGQLVVDKVGEGTILGGIFLVFGWT